MKLSGLYDFGAYLRNELLFELKVFKQMNVIKFILVAVGIILAILLGLSLVGIIYSALFYIFLFGIVAIGGFVGYKLLKKDDETTKIGGKQSIAIAEMKNVDRELEEYKRKYLPK